MFGTEDPVFGGFGCRMSPVSMLQSQCVQVELGFIIYISADPPEL